jgi:hypothetical protein
MVASLLSGLTFTTADEIRHEAAKMAELISILAEDGITPQMLTDGNFTVETFRGMTHVEEFTELLYSMKNYESTVRLVLTYGIRVFTGDLNYSYPADVPITADSADDFETAIKLLPDLFDSMMLERSGAMTATQAAVANSNIAKLKGLSFVSNEVFETLEKYIGIYS